MSMWPSQWIAISAIAKKPEKKDFGASTGFEPVASALALQCSTSLSYEDPHTGGRPSVWVFVAQAGRALQR